MGLANYWRPVDGGTRLPCGAPSSFRDSLNKIFGRFPLTLHSMDIPKLEAFAALEKDHRESCEALIDAINNSEEIEVFSE